MSTPNRKRARRRRRRDAERGERLAPARRERAARRREEKLAADAVRRLSPPPTPKRKVTALQDFKLHDVSLVSQPLDPATRITRVVHPGPGAPAPVRVP